MTATPITISATTSRLVRFVGILGIIAGVIMIVAGGTVWVTVSSQLAAEKITVAEDAGFLAGVVVADPFTAYAEADIISHHALEASGGATYAELDREDPVRITVMNASFLRTSLF
ncbi:MAG: aromatic ring-opening dioxygenase LigA, partial [Microbacteriaceae bacterium]|nr:aromatic ring-opening dioxygenase LigA [Microbacteriaceae bacterium]